MRLFPAFRVRDYEFFGRLNRVSLHAGFLRVGGYEETYAARTAPEHPHCWFDLHFFVVVYRKRYQKQGNQNM